jgi:release factor glutamine methyltransferase
VARTTIDQLRHAAARRFAAVGIDTPLLDANVLLAAALRTDPNQLPLQGGRDVLPEAARRFGELVQRRLAREPVAYITGVKEFMGLGFRVTPAALVPRPETELVVETAWQVLVRTGVRHVIDLGAGCGAIGIALARCCARIGVTASDLSPAALRLAARNAGTLGVDRQVRPVCADGVRGLHLAGTALVANLPYLPTAAIDSLQPEVTDWEPRVALDGGLDGLDAFRRLFRHIERDRPVVCIVEIGAGQRTAVCGLAAAAGFRCACVHLDLASRPRVLELWPEPVAGTRC